MRQPHTVQQTIEDVYWSNLERGPYITDGSETSTTRSRKGLFKHGYTNKVQQTYERLVSLIFMPRDYVWTRNDI